MLLRILALYIYIYNFTGVQALGVIIVYCDNAVSYGPKIIGPHTSGNFNDCKMAVKFEWLSWDFLFIQEFVSRLQMYCFLVALL